MPPAFLHPRQTSDQSLNSSRFADVWRVLAQIQLPGCMMHLMYAIYPALSHLRNGICGCLRLCANLCMVSVISCLWLLQEATLQCLQSRHVKSHSCQASSLVCGDALPSKTWESCWLSAWNGPQFASDCMSPRAALPAPHGLTSIQ